VNSPDDGGDDKRYVDTHLNTNACLSHDDTRKCITVAFTLPYLYYCDSKGNARARRNIHEKYKNKNKRGFSV